jgi:DNA-binding MarR family transcriptional regulator
MSNKTMYFACMLHWTEELHTNLLRLTGAINRPDVDAQFLARTGVKLDRALFPLLTRIGAAGPINTAELAALVGRDQTTVSRQTARLEELGLIERNPSPTDGRIRLLRPSAAGKRMLSEFGRTRRVLMEAYFQDWTVLERSQLLRLLKKLAANIDHPISDP